MIKLYKDENKNNRIKEIVADLRNRKLNWKYLTNNECESDIVHWYGITYGMAKKIVWIVRGDCARQIAICNQIGSDYAMHDAR